MTNAFNGREGVLGSGLVPCANRMLNGFESPVWSEVKKDKKEIILWEIIQKVVWKLMLKASVTTQAYMPLHSNTHKSAEVFILGFFKCHNWLWRGDAGFSEIAQISSQLCRCVQTCSEWHASLLKLIVQNTLIKYGFGEMIFKHPECFRRDSE